MSLSTAGTCRPAISARHGSIVAEQQEATETTTERLATPPGTVLYVNPSMALLEQVLRRGREIGGPRVELPVFSLSTQRDTRLIRPVVSWIGADSADVVVDAGNRVRMAVDRATIPLVIDQTCRSCRAATPGVPIMALRTASTSMPAGALSMSTDTVSRRRFHDESTTSAPISTDTAGEPDVRYCR